MNRRIQADLLLVAATFVWGATFVVVKGALRDASPLVFVAIRFALAGALLVLAFARGRVSRFTRKALVAGAVLGLFLFSGFFFQTWGLLYTTASKSAFITGFSVILVPLIVALGGTRLRGTNVLGAVAGLAGIYILVAPSRLRGINRGDVLTLFAAVAFAVHIVLVGHYTRRISFRELVPVQIVTVALLAALGLPADPGLRLHWTLGLAGAFIVTAVFATAFTFSVQNWAQQYTPAAHTALIFALEPVFAALTSRVVTGERLGARALAGSALILAGMVVSELWGSRPMAVEG